MQPDDAVHLGREPLVVGGDQGGAAFAADQAQELGQHRVGGMLVEIAGRLVGEHQRRPVGERPGDGDALLLAAGKLGRPVVEPRAEPELAEQLLGAGAGGVGVGAVDDVRQHDVLARVEVGQQMVELVDEAERVAAQLACALRRRGSPPPGRAAGSSRRNRPRAVRPPAAASICPIPTGRATRRSRPAGRRGRRRAAPRW